MHLRFPVTCAFAFGGKESKHACFGVRTCVTENLSYYTFSRSTFRTANIARGFFLGTSAKAPSHLKVGCFSSCLSTKHSLRHTCTSTRLPCSVTGPLHFAQSPSTPSTGRQPPQMLPKRRSW